MASFKNLSFLIFISPAPDDYQQTTFDLDFTSQLTSHDFTVPIVNDTLFENQEIFNVQLLLRFSDIAAVEFVNRTARVNIQNDDGNVNCVW